MTDTHINRNHFKSREVVDEYFQHVTDKCEDLVKGVIEAIEDFRRKNNVSSEYQHMLDVGCGSGGATVKFSKHFSRITAIDVSEAQIEKAQEAYNHHEVEFLVAAAEEFPMPSSSIDVIVSIFALQNFDLDKFLKECDRVLKTNGVIVLACSRPVHIYQRDKLSDNSREAELVFKMNDRLKQHAEEIRHLEWHVIDRYNTCFRDIRGFKKSRDDSKTYNENMSVKGFKDHFYSIPFFSLPKAKEICEAAFEELKKEWGIGNLSDEKVEITLAKGMSIIVLSKI